MLDPGPTVGCEQSGRRPYLVASIDAMNRAPAELAMVMPLTTSKWPNLLHVPIDPAESGMQRVSYAMPEMTKTVSSRRLGRRVVPVLLPGRAGRAMRSGALCPSSAGPRGRQTFDEWLGAG